MVTKESWHMPIEVIAVRTCECMHNWKDRLKRPEIRHRSRGVIGQFFQRLEEFGSLEAMGYFSLG